MSSGNIEDIDELMEKGKTFKLDEKIMHPLQTMESLNSKHEPR